MMLISQRGKIIAICFLILLLICVASGCGPQGEQNDAITPLTAEELAYFNSDEFFNGEAYPNIRNQFLISLYDAPQEIDLFGLFYVGNGLQEEITDAEIAAVVAANSWDTAPDCQCTKNSRANMDAVLSEHMGLTLAQTDGVRLKKFTYLKEYDAYYVFHGDTNYRLTITFSRGERQGDLIRLYYADDFMADGNKVLTLRQKKGGYLFIANQMDTSNPLASVAAPEGVVAADIDVPEAVMAAAKDHVRQDYQYWCASSGVYSTVGGEEQMVGEPAVFDNWRIEGLSLVYTYSDLNGQPLSDFQPAGSAAWQALDIYRLDYRIHTLTPGLVTLSGGMDLDEEGWLLPTYPNSTYLYFAVTDGEPQYLFQLMENDCFPGDELFTSDLTARLTRAKEAHIEALAHLHDLYADGATTMWYMAADTSRLPAAIPGERAYVRGEDEPNEARYAILFNCIWQPVSNFTYPKGAYLCLGDSPAACFQFFLGSDLVLWREGENITAWRVGENITTSPVPSARSVPLPDTMMLEFSGYEIDPANVALPAKTGETTADSVERFLAAYGKQLLNLAPENIYFITDFQVTDITKTESKDNRILFWFEMAMRLPESQYATSYWQAGSSSEGQGDLEGWLIINREMVIEQTDGVWYCLDFGTGGASL